MDNRHSLKTLGLGVGFAAALLLAGQPLSSKVLAQTHFHTGGRAAGPEQEPDGFVPVWQQQAQEKAKQDAAKAKQNADAAQKKAKDKSAQ